MTRRYDVITLFPDMIRDACRYGVIGRAIENGLVRVECWTPRADAADGRGTVDDRPFGGGPGMVMMAEPLARTLARARRANAAAKAVYLSPQGEPLTQRLLKRRQGDLILLCGRYEGVDERLLESCIDEQWSVGDFVLSGGEVAALAVIDAMSRLMPGVLGDESSARRDCFMDGLLAAPCYTRPEVWRGMTAPQVLLGGHHGNIERWRLRQALGRTWQRRPRLLEERGLTEDERALLDEFIRGDA